ncbi:NADH-quinone oxidoreductase subunit L [Thalassotalea sp. ND16A]|uniref:NADH-quinone oxidoreductase subunit L n=1 Tax=Thalassotalea sp. ND16A TaxID=1535422 RepID=UPI00051E0BC5|nr:NADH-quinone oxidoreductase subunit L [Thalassotalea sp. ND16A]KGJ97165.1 NADH dehydrogenase (quinone) [Thalassotalea sp. ND16A]
MQATIEATMNQMQVLAYLPFYPLLSFILLVLFAKRLSWLTASILSVGAVLLSALSSAYLLQVAMLTPNSVVDVHLWQWFKLGDMAVNFAFRLDSLSMVMSLVVSGVGLLIHAYAAAYMKDDENFSRFMAYMNLFIVAMLLLVLADNLVLLYLGWEGVGLCSFLLIGFWYQDNDNAMAAKKAFIVTRVGDTFLAIGLFLLFRETGSLAINDITALAGSGEIANEMAFWICLLLVGGAVGKSAQLPLQTWLPDAMAGPTPVSALIHAATMVTAGVYLIARMQGVFVLTPEVMTIVSWIGALTLLLAGIAALAQSDIKRVLAYSTMSQIGYMMLALGAGAFSAGVMHLMTHAFFKALLFLTAGSIILALHHQQNIFKMGGLFKKLPLVSILFFIGIAALIAFPGTSGFVSKEAILAELYSSNTAGPVFWWLAIIGALITSIYSFRLLFITFFGDYRGDVKVHPVTDKLQLLPLVILALLALAGGLIGLNLTALFPAPPTELNLVTGHSDPAWLHNVAIATPFVGIVIAYLLYFPKTGQAVVGSDSSLTKFAHGGLGFDRLYEWLLVKPFVFIAKVNRRDVIEQLVTGISWNVQAWHEVLRASQNGQLRWYGAVIGVGVVMLLAILIFSGTSEPSLQVMNGGAQG